MSRFASDCGCGLCGLLLVCDCAISCFGRLMLGLLLDAGLGLVRSC